MPLLPSLKKIEEAITRAVKSGQITRREDFLWPKGLDRPAVRKSDDGPSNRPVADVCFEEIGEAALLALGAGGGCEFAPLVQQTARLLGYNRMGSDVRSRIETAIQRLVDSGILVNESGHIEPAASA